MLSPITNTPMRVPSMRGCPCNTSGVVTIPMDSTSLISGRSVPYGFIVSLVYDVIPLRSSPSIDTKPEFSLSPSSETPQSAAGQRSLEEPKPIRTCADERRYDGMLTRDVRSSDESRQNST